MGGRTAARRLAVARLISLAGTTAASVALAAELWSRTRDPAWVAAGALSTSLVAALLTPLAGALVDRWDRRRVMIASDAAAGVVFALLAVLVWREAPPLALVAAAALAATCETPFIPASRAALPNLVGDDDLPWANGLLAQVGGLSIAGGPVLGGALAGAFGPQAALAANAASFAVSLALVASVRGSFRRVGSAAEAAVRGGVRAGFAFVARDRVLRATIFAGFVAFLGVGFVIAANPALADDLGAGELGLGALWGGWGLGVIVGARLAPRLIGGGNVAVWVLAGFALQALALGCVAVLPSLWTIVAAQAIGGVGGGIADPARQTLIQRRAPDAMRGRVFAVMEAVGWSSFAVSLVAAGAFVEVVGIRGAYVVACALFVAGTWLMAALGGAALLRLRPERVPA